jgi:hypothetical protein
MIKHHCVGLIIYSAWSYNFTVTAKEVLGKFGGLTKFGFDKQSPNVAAKWLALMLCIRKYCVQISAPTPTFLAIFYWLPLLLSGKYRNSR